MPVVHSHAPSQRSLRSPHGSPHLSPHHSPDGRRSPSRFVADMDWPKPSVPPRHRSQPSEAMCNLEERWKVSAVCICGFSINF